MNKSYCVKSLHIKIKLNQEAYKVANQALNKPGMTTAARLILSDYQESYKLQMTKGLGKQYQQTTLHQPWHYRVEKWPLEL